MIFKLELGYFEIAAMLGAGLYLLTIAADWLVHGSANIARRIGVSSLVIGLTVVGSNIFNIAFILGITA